MIRKLKSGEYRLYSVERDPETHKRRNLGTFSTLEAAKVYKREIQGLKVTNFLNKVFFSMVQFAL
jgi:hypothetical protein